MKKIVFIFLFFSTLINLQGISQNVYIAPTVINYLKTQQTVPVLIYLQEKSNFPLYTESWTKEEKTAYVYAQLKHTANTSQSTLIEQLRQLAIPYQSHFLINAIAAELNADQLVLLRNNMSIQGIYFDEPLGLEKKLDVSIKSLTARAPSLTWGIENIEANKVWDLGYKGQNITVAGEDTGYKWDGSAIKEKYRGWNGSTADHNYNWHDAIHGPSHLATDSLNPCGFNLKVPCDDNSHGTHTVGTMVGSSEEYAIGVAPEAKWIGCRNMERGNGAPSTYIECFEFFLAPTDLDNKNPRTDLAPHVINNSWYCSREEGCDESNYHFMNEAVQNLVKAGIVVVVSAGNEGNSCSTIRYPAAMFDSSFVVGAYASNDTISNFSSCGPVVVDGSNRIKPNVVAPGSDVLSQVPDGSYQGWYGTSMAGPHVAGLVALVISAYPKLAGQVKKIENIIQATARSIASSIDCAGFDATAIPNIMYGYGRINALAAVQKAINLSKLENINEEESYVFPNPGNDELNVVSKNKNERFIVYNVMGIKMTELTTLSGSKTINTRDWPAGMYIIQGLQSHKNFSWIKKY